MQLKNNRIGNRSWVFVIAIGTLCLSHVAEVSVAAHRLLVIERATLIDGTGAPPIPNATIVIDGAKILSVSSDTKKPYPATARVIDAQGKFVLPGLIDAHTHARNWTGPLFLEHGVTSVIDAGNLPEWVFAEADGIAKGRIVGPRMFAVGGILGPPGQPNALDDPRFLPTNPDEMREATESMVAMGAVAIKLNERVTSEMAHAAAQVAHKAGIPVTAHVGEIDAKQAADAGVDALQHATGVAMATVKDPAKRDDLRHRYPLLGYSPLEYYMEPDNYDEVIDFLMSKNVVLIPTLAHYIGKVVSPRRDEYYREDMAVVAQLDPQYFPIEIVRMTYSHAPYAFQVLPADDIANYNQKLQVGWNKLCEFVRRYRSKGGRVLAGSDDGTLGIAGTGIHREMQALVENCGFSPMQAIVASTRDVARFMGKADQLGTVESGKFADLIILDKNPLENIAATKTISTVIKDGEVVDKTRFSNYRNPLPVPQTVGSNPRDIDYLPRIDRIEPDIAAQGTASFTLAIRGRGFVESSIVRWNNIELAKKFVNSHQLEAVVPSELVRNAGTWPVTVSNLGSGGGPSNVSYFILKFK